MKFRRVLGLFQVKSFSEDQMSSPGVLRNFGEGVPAQVLSKSSDRGSKLGAPSQNSPPAASKCDLNITKLREVRVYYTTSLNAFQAANHFSGILLQMFSPTQIAGA
ncbi:hypothetical protein AVEN_29262-1 [Araneus ventricosus]|uniref:Uncharacterized protein n=1 Tax=Araneus ventricosus TaxID=182803 RepID=A0A4Y2IQ72_ARAVE|nr:hypothetical protein AVEN_29262-1 [Araneus ventricosus]